MSEAVTVPTESVRDDQVDEALVAQATAAFDVLRANAATADEQRRLPDASVEALRDCGAFRLWNARRYGGHEASFRTQVEFVAELGRACSASGWVAALVQGSHWMAQTLPVAGQDEIFGADPDAVIAGAIIPGPDPVEVVGDGYRISGRWGFCSGCLHSTWAVLPGMVITEAGPDLRYFFVPRSELAIEDTWYTLGMRGTGSNTFVADKVFVPEQRAFGMFGPHGALAGVTRTERQEELLYRMPMAMAFPNMLMGAVIGIARAAVDHVQSKLPSRSIAYSTYTQSSAAVSTQLTLAEARTRLDMATLLAYRAVDDCVAAAGVDPLPGLVQRMRAKNDAAYAASELRDVVLRLAKLAGASSVAESDPLNRLYRDASTATLHGILQTATSLESYGAALCDQPVTNSILV
jgi:3-hydroxy-9,10-secoandrosta-1,3,5(10)-triene-9,17-dione monooxygenase